MKQMFVLKVRLYFLMVRRVDSVSVVMWNFPSFFFLTLLSVEPSSGADLQQSGRVPEPGLAAQVPGMSRWEGREGGWLPGKVMVPWRVHM